MSGVLGGLPFEMGAEGVIASLIGIVTLLLSVTIISTLSATDGSSRRARMLRARRATLKENAKKPSRVSAASRSHADSLAGLIIAHLRKAHRRRSDSLTRSGCSIYRSSDFLFNRWHRLAACALESHIRDWSRRGSGF